ncbi:hypothetical protein NDU88_005045 [Pleurodeles waltl]|uniref:Uncharacterized protein n=1 Tax=Pleurodeles waltl TaxID=8319 RepID=A0AAV7SKN5_PLEWA|nr:hypothetical protein NDU88_005045 [Pleurodeles waltl]
MPPGHRQFSGGPRRPGRGRPPTSRRHPQTTHPLRAPRLSGRLLTPLWSSNHRGIAPQGRPGSGVRPLPRHSARHQTSRPDPRSRRPPHEVRSRPNRFQGCTGPGPTACKAMLLHCTLNRRRISRVRRGALAARVCHAQQLGHTPQAY